MTKWVVDTVELIRKQYVTDAYTKEAAEEKAHLQPPRTKVSLGEITHSVTSINEYEYHKDWSKVPEQKDWVGPSRYKSEWINAHQDGRPMPDDGRGDTLGTTGDKLKGPALNEIW